MSDHSQGPGWWLASDGRWYAPELHPSYVPPAPAAGPAGLTPPLPPAPTQLPPVVTQVLPSSHALEDVAIVSTRSSSAANVVRRRWAWGALPVIAGGLALAIVLPLTMGGTSKTTSNAPQKSTGASGLTGSYIANAPGPDPLYLTLAQSGNFSYRDIHGCRREHQATPEAYNQLHEAVGHREGRKVNF